MCNEDWYVAQLVKYLSSKHDALGIDKCACLLNTPV